MTAVPPDEVAIAEARAAAARERLKATVDALQRRTQPAVLAQDGLKTVQRYPAHIAGAAAVVLAFLARRKLARAVRRMMVTRPKPKQPVVMDVQPTPIAPIRRIRE